MRELVERMSVARGRFVPLNDGAYLALTEKLREKIDALARAEHLVDKKGRAPMALLPALEQWADGAELAMTDAVRDKLASLRQALATTPRVPRGLQAELRDYQRDGFLFLARLAQAGLGACLADDMGLGKTVQALALLLARARSGPALVVAPTSVCRNWHDEARRFAPQLRVHALGDAADRAACLGSVVAGDVLLVSYGLLVVCAEMLVQKRFATIVFDEAHALKNPDTRRAAAARALFGDARVALTGTPVENRLGELHALFDQLAPGLLGARERFERAFASPIAQGDKHAAAQLRTVVRPFVLRRTKAQVLDELPEKTEITRVVSPSADERAFYEALRRRALERVEKATRTAGNRARIDVLAEITKLRRAAIDPRLVGGDEAPAGAKLEVLAEIVRELGEEGHRALVFSQFLEVLDRAGERLAADGVRCVRLDGTMNADARAAAVEAFQSAQADVFLLSLRAGGVGMNLTAADYVIHLDPWWNPAVEDQATDRAHRIGQQRPVTVVRLVTEGTIEEKVLRLHASKRALYSDAIGETGGARIDLDELASLLLDGASIAPRATAS
jgi:SNF2 family DNA or RNA helicase